MKIAALDTYVTDFDGLSWEELEALGDFSKYDQTTPNQVIERASACEAVIVNKIMFNEEVFEKLPELRYVGVTATGTNNVDLKSAKERGIAVTNVPGYSTDSVAQMVFAYLLHLFSKVGLYDRLVHEGEWSKSHSFCFQNEAVKELAEKTIGIIGHGAIGKKVAETAKAFGMKVILAGFPKRDYKEERLPVEEVFRLSDFVTLHCPLTPETEGLVNKKVLDVMKPGGVLINTARGGLVKEKDLADALRNGRPSYACLDVLSSEPPSADNPILSVPNAIITPHIAWGTREARERLVHETAENLQAFLRGEKRNRVEG